MDYPHTTVPREAFLTAEGAVAATFTVVLARWPLSEGRKGMASRAATVIFGAGLWICALAPLLSRHLPFALLSAPLSTALSSAGVAVAVAFVLVAQRDLAVGALFLTAAVARARIATATSDLDFSGAELAGIGLLYGVFRRLTAAREPEGVPTTFRPTAPLRDDALIFALAALAATLVALFILERFPETGDEWANTYQAELFAHLKAYGPVPACPDAFRNFWVFFYEGRAFSQYTPGWPLVMAPFQALHAVFLAAPFCFGAMAVGVARLARRFVAESATQLRAAGALGALFACAGPSLLLQGGSRFPHPLSCACFVWSFELTLALLHDKEEERRRRRDAVLLGLLLALGLATRPVEGALAALPVALALLSGLAHRQLSMADASRTSAAFLVLALFVSWILRLQLGEWGKTGYSLTHLFQPELETKLEFAQPDSYKYAWPLMTGAYMWWPAAPALGLAGLFLARGRARVLALMLGLVLVASFFLFPFLTNLHYAATGLGPRFHVFWEIVFAIGGAALLTPLLAAVNSMTDRGLAALATIPLLAGTLALARLLYPAEHNQILSFSAPFRAIEAAGLHRALVTTRRGQVAMLPRDLNQNSGTDPDPDVLLAEERSAETMECLRRSYPGRTWYRAVGKTDAVLVPWAE